ncbi:MAG: hypothetical protein DCE90_05400 [Pseudanabaena sp.]|nr:MAG: hypothetical protein DCE90_05400 [Pseudanabaena sp.]
MLGFALSAGTVGILVNQQSANNSPTVTPVAASSLTLTDVMSQNQERKYEMARMAIASGSWDKAQGVVVHEVREDETLWKLTQVYQVDAAAIAASNGISAGTELQAGMKLMIPPVNGLVHQVKSGDTLEAISAYYNVPKSEIIKFTSLTSGDFLAIDQPLVIPGNVSTLMQVKEGHVKRQLLAEKERLEKRLQELEGKKIKATLATAKATNDENAIAKQPKQISYKVQNGDTIETIARRYGITQKSIIEANKLENPQWLELNQELKLPQPQPLGSVQTVAASLNQKPLKQVPSPVGQASEDSVSNSSSNIATPVRVTAATPMVLPKELVTKLATASRVSPWDGLIQLTGSEKQTTSSDLSAQERGTVSVTAQSNAGLAGEPVAKVAASLFPFAPDQLLGNIAGGSGKESSSATALSINLPARSLATPSIPALTASEQFSDSRAIPIEAGSSQPVAEPRVQLPIRVAAALSVPQIPSTLINEQKVDLQNVPAENVSQPALEPAAKSSPVAAVVVPRIPSSQSIEQDSATNSVPASPTVQPALEANVQIPARLAASLAPKIPSAGSVDQSSTSLNTQAEKISLLPDPEARMSTLEVKRLESEVEQLNSKVREAEIKEAARRAEEARKLEAAKIAAASLNATPNPDRDFDASRSAIANPGDRSGIEPQLPQLMASAYLPDVQDYGLSTGFIWPADGVFTSGYGWRWGRIHQGIDIAAPVGTPILAAASGVVEYSSWNDGGYGNMIDIRHADGTITRYAHMNDLYVKAGQTVSQGQLIGAMGSTGFSTGPHLHFEIRPNGGSAIDPMVFLAKATR